MGYFKSLLALSPAGTLLLLILEFSLNLNRMVKSSKKNFFLFVVVSLFLLVTISCFFYTQDASYLMTLRDLFFWCFILLMFNVSNRRLKSYYKVFETLFWVVMIYSIVMYFVSFSGLYDFGGVSPGSYFDYLFNNPIYSETFYLGESWKRFNSVFLYATSAGWGIALIGLIYFDRFLSSHQRNHKVRFFVLYLLCFSLVFLTASRTSLLLMLFFTMAFFMLRVNLYVKFFSAVFIVPFFLYFSYELLLLLLEQRQGSADSRLTIYRASIEYLINNPLGYFKTMPIPDHMLDAGTHSTYLAVGIKYGLIGLAVLFYAILAICIPLLKRNEKSSLLFVCFLLALGLVEEITIDPFSVLLVGFLIAYMKSQKYEETKG